VTSRPGRASVRAVLARPAYRRLWAARTVSQAGDVVQFTTVALLVFHLTGSGVGVAFAVLAEAAPVLLLAPVAGPIVDRLSRVTVMVAADVVRLVLAAVLVLGHEHLAVVYACAFGLSAGAVFFNPAAGSLLPTLVRPDQVVAANSGIWSAAVLTQVALAPAAGLLVTWLGFGPAFAVNAVSFGLSALLLRGLRREEAPRPATARTNLLVDGAAAARLLLADRLLRALAGAQLLAALSAGATSALLVVLAREHLRVDGRGFGLMLAAVAVGAFTGPLVLTRLAGSGARAGLLFAAFGLRGVVDFVLAAVTVLPVALLSLVVYGIGTSVGSVTFASVIQTHVDERLRGRAFAGFDLLWQGGRIVSLLGGGLVADTLGIAVVYVIGGCLLLAAAALGWSLRSPRRAAPPGPAG